MDIKILGAGVGGLTTAIALTQKGFSVSIYERGCRRSDIGAGVVCWPNATFVLNELGLLEKISQVSGQPNKMCRYSHLNEKLGCLDIDALDEKMGFPSFAILRKDLMFTLENHLNILGVYVDYNHEVQQLIANGSDSGSIKFSNNVVETADLIIGADGRMTSVSRAFVNGDNKAIYQGFINWVGICEKNEVIVANQKIKDYWGVGARFGIVPISESKVYWAGGVAAPTIEPNNVSAYKSELMVLFDSWPSPIKDIINDTLPAKINKIYVHDHHPISTWHRGNVLLIGDAAHAPLPTSGQGACQAMEDAWHLTEILCQTQMSLDEKLAKFTKTRSAKTANIILGARQFASSLFDTDANNCDRRNDNSRNTDFDLVLNGMAKGWADGLPLGV